MAEVRHHAKTWAASTTPHDIRSRPRRKTGLPLRDFIQHGGLFSSPRKTPPPSPSTPASRPGVSVTTPGDVSRRGTIRIQQLITNRTQRQALSSHGYVQPRPPSIAREGMVFQREQSAHRRSPAYAPKQNHAPHSRGSIDDPNHPEVRTAASAEPPRCRKNKAGRPCPFIRRADDATIPT